MHHTEKRVPESRITDVLTHRGNADAAHSRGRRHTPATKAEARAALLTGTRDWALADRATRLGAAMLGTPSGQGRGVRAVFSDAPLPCSLQPPAACLEHSLPSAPPNPSGSRPSSTTATSDAKDQLREIQVLARCPAQQSCRVDRSPASQRTQPDCVRPSCVARLILTLSLFHLP